jgi:hypothetical protein
VQLTGARVASALLPEIETQALEAAVLNPDITPIPYSPGQEPLWPAPRAKHGQGEANLVHPLAPGAEAYYTYATGATTRIGLPDGRAIVLRELKVRPRAPESNLAVGSLWFDEATGQLVRAAYRLAAPIPLHVQTPNTLLGSDTKPNPIAMTIIKGIVSPFNVKISGVAVEYARYDGRYWLPKSRSLEATARVSFAKARVELGKLCVGGNVRGI